MNIQTKTPVQYSEAGKVIKRFLHTKLGAFIGYHFGISGFNRIVTDHGKFQRYYTAGEKLRRKEYIQTIEDGPNAGRVGVYRLAHGVTFNSRVDAGAALTASLMSGSTLGGISAPAAPKYLATSSTSLTPAHGDTTLTGEISTNGFARALATAGSYSAPASLDAAASFTFSKTFTATGSQTVNSAALFDASSAGNLFVEGNLSSTVNAVTNDTLAITWTVNV